MTGLVGWWPLHKNSGSTARDLSGNGNHGTVNEATQGVAGVGGLQCYSFDGSNDMVSNTSTISGMGVNTECTITCWFYSKESNNGILVNYKNGSSDRFSTSFDNGEINAGMYDGSWLGEKSAPASLNEWHHLAAVWEGSSTMQLYLDGNSVGSSGASTSTRREAGTYIGRKKNGERPFKGMISDVRLYSRELSPQEIQTLYKWGSGDYASPPNDRTDSSAVSRWPLDGNADDVWGSNDGTVSGPSAVDGVRGEAYDFNDSGDEIVVPNNSRFHGGGTRNFSVSAWVKPHSISDDRSNDRNTFLILRRSGTDPRVGWKLGFPSRSEIQFLLEDSDNSQLRLIYSRSSNFDLSSWYHVTGVRRGESASVFVNGVERASATTSGFGDISTSEELYIGQTNDTDSNYPDAFNGTVDDVRIYDRALSPHEVFQLYQWGTRGRDMRKLTINARGDQ